MSLAGNSVYLNGLIAWGIDAVIAATETVRFRPHSNLVNPIYPVINCKRVENSSKQDILENQGTVPSGRRDKLKIDGKHLAN